VHHFVEKQLVALIGDVGYKLHSGRSRNEQIATDLRLYVRATIDQLRPRKLPRCAALVGSRGTGWRCRHAGVYASATSAEPVLVGALAAGLCGNVFARRGAAGGLPQALERISAGIGCGGGRDVAAGSGADGRSAGASMAPTANSIDATSDRDFALEFVNALVCCWRCISADGRRR
jgi:argininosuccinate lyase